MRWLITLMIVMPLATAGIVGPCWAETMYVTDVLLLKMRSGPGSGSDIVEVLQSGQMLEVVSDNDKWAQIRLPDGREGWVQSQYLTAEKTAALRLARLQQQFDANQNELAALRAEAAKLKKQTNTLQTELTQQRRQAEKATTDFKNLKKESTGFLELKNEHKSAVAKATEQSSRIIELEKELTRLETQRLVRWFLAGAGVLLLGFIIGLSARRQRRKYLT